MSTIGTIELIAKIDTSQYKRGANEIESANRDIEASGEKSSNNLSGSFSKVAKVGLAALAAAVVAVGAVITSNIGGAITRVDTLNNSTRTFENMGFATETVNVAMEALEKSIRGLPTSLDAGVRGMTSLAATYGDVSKGQKVFTALNNAILGFGGSADEVNNAVQQLSQLPMDGPLDAQTWNSLRNSGLTPVLVAMSKDMGISINEMKEKFGEGELTVRDFTDALVKMNTDGGGGMKSLEQIARDSTSGIATSWENMKTAITRGIAEIIEYIGSKNIADTLSSIGKGFEAGLKAVPPVMDIIIGVIQKVLEIIKPLTDYIANNKEAWEALKNILLALGIIFGTLIIGVVVSVIAIFAVLQSIINGTINVIEGIIGAFNWYIETVKSVISWISQLWRTVVEAFSAIWNAINNAINNAGSLLYSAGRAIIEGLINGIRSMIGGIWSGISEASATIGRFFAGAGDWLYGVGQSIVQGLINGITSMVGAAADAAKKVASSAVDGAKNLLKIQSPSRVFADIGKNVSLGFADGISSAGGLVNSAMSDIIGGMTPAMIGVNALGSIDDPVSRTNGGVVVNINGLNMSGIMSRSRADERIIAKNLVQSINEELTSKGAPLIGGGNI